MPLFAFEGKSPRVHPTAFIAPTAVLIGDVTPAGGSDIGAGSTVGHLCLIHQATLGEECLVGNGSTVLDGVKIGVRAMIGAGSLVTPGTEIPDGVLALGSPCKVRGPLAGTPAERWVAMNPKGYQALAQRHRVGVTPA